VSEVWITVAGLVVTTAAIKASGPVLLGGRRLPAWALAVIALFAPALLAALVVTQTFGTGDELVVDERALGIGAAAIALWRGASILPTVALAAVVTALARAVL
jgi:branched-subunit amino acid transport protein